MRSRSWFWAGLVLLPLLVSPACSPGGPNQLAQDEDHKAKVDEWHAGRVERLRKPAGWLTLVGLHRLPAGENSFGSAADNDLVFPANAPAHAGVLRNVDGNVSIEAYEGVELLVGEEAITSMDLRNDREEDTTVVTMGSLQFHVIERAEKQLLRVRDLEHPVLETFEGIERYPVTDTWRKVARFERFDPPKLIEVPDVLGNVNAVECPGALVFEHDGSEHRLLPLPSGENELFIIFGDASNGDATYGGGRFLYSDFTADATEVVVDFNLAYNPPCVFTPYATCSLPPAGNTLSIDVPAGEKMVEGFDAH